MKHHMTRMSMHHYSRQVIASDFDNRNPRIINNSKCNMCDEVVTYSENSNQGNESDQLALIYSPSDIPTTSDSE